MKQVKFRIPQRAFMLFVGLVLSVCAMAQITVNGHVKDGTGEDVIGATVRVVGADGGTVTDFEGKFSLKCKQGADLQISYVGYQTKTVKATPQLEIILEEDAAVLDNVVVIGYGVAKKNDLTGSVTAIKPDEKNHGLITSAQDMLQGKVAGVNVNSGSGAPGEGAQIRIRGGASLNASNDPLIVIDGMAMDNNATKGMSNPLSLVNPNDIESFTVLKDASATAIYGSRGSNGVIIITTKKGRRNQATRISYNANVSASTVGKKLDVMNAADYRAFIKKYYGEDSPAYAGLGDANTDWQDEIYRTGLSHDHNVSVAGGVGGEKWSMPYRVSVGYTDQQGTLRGSDYNRFTAGFTLNPSLLDDHLNLNINAKYAYSHNRPGNSGAIGNATRMDPTRPVASDAPVFDNWTHYWQWVKTTSAYDPTFPYARNDDAPSNPVEQALINGFKKYANVLLGNFEADYKIHGLEDLRFHINLAGEYSRGAESTDQYRQSTAGFYYGSDGLNQEKKYNVTLSSYLQYYKDFNDDHHFDIMGGYEYSHFKYWGNSYSTGYYPMTNEKNDDNGNPLAGTKYGYGEAVWKGQTFLVSWYGRMNYILKDRYLLTFTARYDGSSRFADGHRWGFFPSAALAWKAKEETFLKNVDAISDLKVRLGWGKTGQQDTGMEYYTPNYSVSTSDKYLYPVGGGNNDGILYRPLAYNNELTWETTTTYNVGLDLGFFKNRLVINADAYIRKTTDLLNCSSVPTGTNFDNKIWTNAGELENRGVEVAVTGKIIQTNDWYWELSANAGYNKNKITKLYGGRDVVEAGMQVGTNEQITYHKVGLPANSFFVYQQVYDEAGRPIQGCYVDRNADGQIDDKDRYFYKSIAAPWTGGFSTKISYKNWDLGTNFRAAIGNYLYNGIVSGKINTSVLYNSKGYYENTTPAIAELGWTSYNYSLSDYFVQNGSYLKCDNITLGYNFGEETKGFTGRVYASCTNVFTITNYTGLDPEQNSGRESSVYPRSRTYLLGLSLNF